jgi:membrane dipeptidase
MAQPMIPVFDGHNDTILSLRETGRSFFERSATGHIDFPRAKAGGLAGGFFAVWVPSPHYEHETDIPATGTTEAAQASALQSLGGLLRVAAESNGQVTIVRTAAEVRTAIDAGVLAMELHIEGAEPIDENLLALDVFYAAGVRSLGLVWSRPNIFGSGVPFKFPSSPDTGPGLTDAGKALVAKCNELGVIVDLSHLNEAGFWDVAKVSKHPLVATHSAVHEICASSRNLTQKQLDAIKDSDGIVGCNFHVGFLRPDGQGDGPGTTVEAIANHVDALVEKLGVTRVALGSDYDGATMPGDLKDVEGLPLLIAELRKRGYDDDSLLKIGYKNWLRIFEATWKA